MTYGNFLSGHQNFRERLSWHKLTIEPSPIYRLKRLEKEIGFKGEIWIKREDRLRNNFGHKIRYLEYVIGEFYSKNHNSIIWAGGDNSNYLFQIALLGKELNIKTHLYATEAKQGNLGYNAKLAKLLCPDLTILKIDEKNSNAQLKAKKGEYLKNNGENPLILSYPTSNYFGYAGYVRFYKELKSQIELQDNLIFDTIVMCSGWHSFLGLTEAINFDNNETKVIGVRPGLWSESSLSNKATIKFEDFLNNKIIEFWNFLDLEIPSRSVKHELINLRDEKGYGTTNDDLIEVIRLLAKTEGIFLDPIYNAKAFLEQLRRIKSGEISDKSKTLFVYSGGQNNFYQFIHKI